MVGSEEGTGWNAHWVIYTTDESVSRRCYLQHLETLKATFHDSVFSMSDS